MTTIASRHHIVWRHSELLKMAPGASSIILSGGGLLLQARSGADTYLSPLMFGGFSSPAAASTMENYLRWHFGRVRSISSLGQSLFDQYYPQPASPYLRATPHGGDFPSLASGLILAGREFARPGFYPHMYHVDRNSAHPAACVGLQLPWVYFMRVTREPSDGLLDIILRQEGFGSFKVVCGLNLITGALPVRVRGGIEYPGSAGDVFGGIWTLNEVRHALECGYKILECPWVGHGRMTAPYLEQFMLDAYANRLAAQERGDLLGVGIWKGIANKMVGRLGMGGGAPPKELKRVDRGAVRFLGVEWEPTGRIFRSRTNRLASAYVFAEQRIALHKALLSAQHPVYAFTDSVVCSGLPDVRIGAGLGEWKLYSADRQPYEIVAKGKYRSRLRVASRGVKGGLRKIED